MKKHKVNLFELLSWIWLIVCFGIFIVFLNIHLTDLLDSDMSSEMILAKELAKRREWVFSSNWIYSTEIRVLNTQLVFGALFRIIDDWHVVRILGTVILLLMMLGSMYFLCCQIKLKKEFPIIGSFLVLPISEVYFNIVLYGTYYIPYIIISFVLMALMLRYTCTDKGRMRYLDMFFVGLISALSGMAGLRQLLIFFLPMVMAAFIIFVISLKGAFNIECFKKAFVKEILQKNQLFKFLMMTLISVGTSSVGYLINKIYLVNKFRFVTYETLQWVDFSLEKISVILNGWFKTFGYLTERRVISYASVCNIASFVIITFLVIAILSFFRHYESQAMVNNILCVFFICSVIIFIVLYSFTNMAYIDRYNLPIAVFSVFVIAIFLKEWKAVKFMKQICVLILCFFCSILAFRNYHHDSLIKNEKREIADFLVNHGYFNGYATFYNGNVLTELSNGKIEVWVTESGSNVSELYEWLQKKDHFTCEPQGKVFFITTEAEKQEKIIYSYLQNEDLIFQTSEYLIYGYEDINEIPNEIKGVK